MDVLELLARARRHLAATVISRRCTIPRSSTYHLLAALRNRGYVIYHDDTRLWSLGHRLAELGGEDPAASDVLALLDAFDSRSTRLGPAELAHAGHMALAGVERALEILAHADLVAAHPDGSYSLGVHVAALAARLPELERLRLAARPRLVELRDRTKETANLLIRSGDTAVYLDQVESQHALRHTGWLGRSIPLATSAAGRALADTTRIHVVSDVVEPGVTAVASAVDARFDHPAAISVTGPTSRVQGAMLDVCKVAIAEAAAKIAHEVTAPSR
jgi:IclR family transcriptional regulator, acetate operon repressor